MTPSKEEYLSIVRKKLKKVKNADEIILELDQHLTDLLEELSSADVAREGETDELNLDRGESGLAKLSEAETMEQVIDRVGSPEQVASLYLREHELTPSKVQWLFISVNLFFFAGGICLTLLYHLQAIPSITQLWQSLISISSVLIILYMFFWILLGYEIGKEFGLGGRQLLKKTFYITLLPNLILMALVIFQIVPTYWFQPLLTPSFILICILCTACLYPICYIGFRWGSNQSI